MFQNDFDVKMHNFQYQNMCKITNIKIHSFILLINLKICDIIV